MRIFLFISFLCTFAVLSSQILPNDSTGVQLGVSKERRMKVDSADVKIYRPTINDYLYWTEADHSKKPVDTTLSLKNEYRYTQFNNQDNFKKVAFNNIGQPFNTLLYDDLNDRIFLLPSGKRQIYKKAEEIRYFDVKTPTTEFIYHNGMKEGQSLYTLFTYSINSQLNFAVEYNGIRSLGKYLESEVDSRTFITSLNFHSKNKKYQLWTHYYNLNNGAVENAGIQNRENFTSGDRNYRNRQRLLVNLNGARSKYLNRRYFLGQSYNFLKAVNDSIAGKSLLLKNIISYESNDFRYYETADNEYYGNLSSYLADTRKEANKFNKTLSDVATLAFNASNKYDIELGAKFENVKYNFDNPEAISFNGFPYGFEDNRIGFVGELAGNFSDKFRLSASAEFMAGNFFGNTFNAEINAQIKPASSFELFGSIKNSSQTPSLNLLYNQSFYENFNYYLDAFKNVNTSIFEAGIDLMKFKSTASLKGFNIENYTYLNYLGKPVQSSQSTQIMQLNLQNKLDIKKFHFDTQLTFQNVAGNGEALPLPAFVGRLNIFYKSMMFKNAANVQIGLKTKYFTSFNSPEYFPVVNEFKLQQPGDEIKIGNYPVMDFYFDIRVKSMQIYLEAQHFNSFFTGYNYFSTPNIPLYDFRLNISLVWYIFT